MKSDIDPITKGFLCYLEKSGQLGKLSKIAKDFIRLSRTTVNPNLATVETVVSMTTAEKKSLSAKLQTVFKRPITVDNRLNKNILGGMLIRVGDQVVDVTLQTRLSSLQEKLSYPE